MNDYNNGSNIILSLTSHTWQVTLTRLRFVQEVQEKQRQFQDIRGSRRQRASTSNPISPCEVFYWIQSNCMRWGLSREQWSTEQWQIPPKWNHKCYTRYPANSSACIWYRHGPRCGISPVPYRPQLDIWPDVRLCSSFRMNYHVWCLISRKRLTWYLFLKDSRHLYSVFLWILDS